MQFSAIWNLILGRAAQVQIIMPFTNATRKRVPEVQLEDILPTKEYSYITLGEGGELLFCTDRQTYIIIVPPSIVCSLSYHTTLTVVLHLLCNTRTAIYMNHCWWSRWWWLFRAIRPFIIALNYIRCFSNKHALLRDSQTKSVCSFAAVLRFHFYYFQTCESQIDTEKHLRTLTPQSTRTITRWKAHNNMLVSKLS